MVGIEIKMSVSIPYWVLSTLDMEDVTQLSQRLGFKASDKKSKP